MTIWTTSRSNLAMIELPQLSDYDVSPLTGFLPEKAPVSSLPDYYSSWEYVVGILPSLLLSNRLRKVIEGLPLLEVDQLETTGQQRRAYAILGFLGHAYVWGNGAGSPTEAGANNHLPKCIAEPWVKISEKLGVPPVATYAGLCLWNWNFLIKPAHEDPASWELDDFINNIKTINTFSGSTDESWFYIVSVFFEYRAAPCIPLGLNILQACRENNTNQVIELLQEFAERIDELGTLLLKMEELCDPHVFYFKLRPYLAGWKNMKDAGLPEEGVYYGDEKKPRVLSGGSNAQSSFVQFMDLILNVNHTSTGEKKNGSNENPFMAEMRQYMPKKHAEFLVHLSKVNCLRSYVLEHSEESPDLVLAYDAAVAMLLAFRDKHIRIVTRYIIIQAAKKSKMAGESVKRTGMAGQFDTTGELRGTGGTSLLPFLKQCRDETGNTAAGYWGRRLLKFKSHPKEFAPDSDEIIDSPNKQ